MREKQTVQIGLRIDKVLLEEVDYYSVEVGMDRMALIRQAIKSFVLDLHKDEDLEATEDYITGIIDEGEFLEITGMKKVPGDIQEARKSRLIALSKKGLGR